MTVSLGDFARVGVLGEGTYGVVYKAVEKTEGFTVAIKKMHSNELEEGFPLTALREISFLQELQHPNIVRLLNVICSEGCVYLVLEFVESDLRKTLRSKGPFTGTALKVAMYQLLSALAFCHQNRIVHRDLKPGNILISANNNVKLADFGLARAFQVPLHTYTHDVVTLWYRAPEILLGESHYTPAVDIWSAACVFAELVLGKVFLMGNSEIGQIYEIFKVFGFPTDSPDSWPGVTRLKYFKAEMPHFKGQPLSSIFESLCPDGLDLLTKMFSYCPIRRITAKEALFHPWFSGIKSLVLEK